MKNSKKNLFNPYFSHIYVEKEAFDYPNCQAILSHFINSKIIEINHYKDVFCRSHQNFYLQKQSPNLILAVKKENLIYKGAKFCDDFGNENFYYTSSMMNCIYNCEYCYLQGMYPSANIVIFVNLEDIFLEIDKLLTHNSIYLCISYDTDILALESILGYGAKWVQFAKQRPNLKIELRTKSTGFNLLPDKKPCNNIILAWTLSPDLLVKNYEDKTPSLLSRLKSAKTAIDLGWQVRLCFDPLLYIENWQENYQELIKTVFLTLPKDKILDISIGVFRVSSDYLKVMRKQRPASTILNYPFTTENRICTYPQELSQNMVYYVYNLISCYISREKIYI